FTSKLQLHQAKKLLDMTSSRLGNPGSTHHTGELVDAGIASHKFDTGDGPPIENDLFDAVLIVGKGGHLRQVSHADDLITGREFLELTPHGFCGFSPDTGINFIKNKGLMGTVCSQDGS